MGHGDCLAHEIILWESDTFVHELLFERNACFIIECKDIQHSETLKADLIKRGKAGEPVK